MTAEVTQELRVEDEQSAQVAIVKILDKPVPLPDEEMVAKFYDPLYYGLINRLVSRLIRSARSI